MDVGPVIIKHKELFNDQYITSVITNCHKQDQFIYVTKSNLLGYIPAHTSIFHILNWFVLYRTQDPNLWVQALSYFAGREVNCKTYIVEVLSHVDRRNLLPPLLVIQTLAHNSTATLSVVKVCNEKYVFLL